MGIRLLSLALTVASFVSFLHADYNRLYFTDCGSQGVTIQKVDMTPMPIFHPGIGYLTFVADLKRPVSKCAIDHSLNQTSPS